MRRSWTKESLTGNYRVVVRTDGLAIGKYASAGLKRVVKPQVVHDINNSGTASSTRAASNQGDSGMAIRLLISLGLAGLLSVPVHAQGMRPQPEPPNWPGFALPRGFQIADSLRVAPRPGLEFSLNKLRALRSRLDTSATACPMPVMRGDPSTDVSMPVQARDSTVSPAANRSLTLPSCYNRFTQ